MPMFKKIIKKSITVSFIEQLTINLGNFLFFIFSARISGPEDFGLFGIFFIASQLIMGISFQWILLPITSRNITFNNLSILRQIFKKTILIFTLTPIFLYIYFSIISNISYGINTLLISYCLTILIIISDISRFFLIRLRIINCLIVSNIIKWLSGYFLIFNFLTKSENKSFSLLIIFIITLFIGLIIQITSLIYSGKIKGSIITSKLKLSHDNSLLGLGFANLVNTITVTMIFSKLDLLAFGAFQAFRSITNFFPFLLQFLETHYSSILINENKNKFIKKSWIKTYFLIVIFSALFINISSENIVNRIYGNQYIDFHFIIVLQFINISIQSISRLISIQIRLQDKFQAFNRSSLILFLFSLILICINLFFVNSFTYILLIGIIITTSFFQLINFIYFFKNQ